MASSRLSALQRDLLEAFFERTEQFFLTGGAALAGFHLGHRETRDLDLFATPEVDLEDGVRSLRAAASALNGEARLVRESPDFRRFEVSRGDETTLVDLVIDRAPQVMSEKLVVGRIRIDPEREIAANKLCALLSRAEPRDLVDLELLLGRGFTIEDVLADAQRRDAGADAATLAWVLSEMLIPPTAPIPGGRPAADLDAFRGELVRQLLALALPREEP